ncbi:regulatory protein RecX [Modestobacter sp. NPDC049651]|uniref:regulatory protein RecX n=1 Tax=unclassified Modestobacter TaxID=2643866 RepID=UPI0033CC110E
MKTRKQLADLLAKKDVPEAAAAAVLDRFTEVGLIDDAAFAAAWVSSRQSGRGLSRRALAQELRAKGVDGELAQEALEQVDSQDEWDTARRLVARKMPSMARLDRVTAERRLVGMLARKGYGGGLAGWVVREALDDRESTLLAADEAADELDDGPETAPPPAGSWSNRRRPAPQADPWAELEAARAAKAAGAAAEPATETGEGQVRRIARRSTAPAPDWLGDDTP